MLVRARTIGLLGMLWIGGCAMAPMTTADDDDDATGPGDDDDCYDVTTEIHLDGIVVAADDGEPVAGIEVALMSQTTVTDVTGAWELHVYDRWCTPDPNLCALQLDDYDGADHGQFERTEFDVPVDESVFSWSCGDEFTYEAHDVLLVIDPLDPSDDEV